MPKLKFPEGMVSGGGEVGYEVKPQNPTVGQGYFHE